MARSRTEDVLEQISNDSNLSSDSDDLYNPPEDKAESPSEAPGLSEHCRRGGVASSASSEESDLEPVSGRSEQRRGAGPGEQSSGKYHSSSRGRGDIMSTEEDSDAEPPKKKTRKRLKHPDKWVKNKRKQRRNSGRKYRFASGAVVSYTKPDCRPNESTG